MSYKTYETVLPNGLTLVVTEMPHVHSADLTMFIRVGSRYETPEKNGMSHFLEHMLFNGTQKYVTPQILNKKLMQLGNGEFNGSTSNENTMFYLTIHPSKIRDAMEVFSEIFLNSLLDEKALQEEKKVIIEEIKGEEESNWDKLDNAMAKLLWAGHPLGQRILGPAKIVKGFTRAELLEHYNLFYVPENMILSVAGRVNKEEVEALTVKYFGGMKSTGEVLPQVEPPVGQGPQVIFQTEDVGSTYFQLSFINTNYPANRFAFWMVKDLVSEAVFTELRLKKGLVYDLYTKSSENMDIATLDIEGCVSPQKFMAVMETLTQVLSKIRQDGFSQEELDQMRHSYRCSLDFSLDRPASLAARFAQDRFYGGVTTIEAEIEIVEKITRQDLRDLADQLFEANNRYLLVFSEKTLSRIRKQKVRELVLQGF